MMSKRETLTRDQSQAETIYRKLAAELESKHFGKIVGIHLDTGRYFIGDDELLIHDEATEALGTQPLRLVFLRIGGRTVHYVGADGE